MNPLYARRSCGFLSTLRGEFARRKGLLFDHNCLEKADAGIEPATTWVREATAREAADKAKASDPRPCPLSLAGEA